MTEHTETRWAVWNYKREHFCGRFCWPTTPVAWKTIQDACEVPTFRTRALAREAIRRMNSYRTESRPMKMTVKITITDRDY